MKYRIVAIGVYLVCLSSAAPLYAEIPKGLTPMPRTLQEAHDRVHGPDSNGELVLSVETELAVKSAVQGIQDKCENSGLMQEKCVDVPVQASVGATRVSYGDGELYERVEILLEEKSPRTFFPLGKYKITDSPQFKRVDMYLTEIIKKIRTLCSKGRNCKIDVTYEGGADSVLYVNSMYYDGQYGDINLEKYECRIGGVASKCVLETGSVIDNEKLSLLRSAAIKRHLRLSEVFGGMHTDERHDLHISDREGDKYRYAMVKITVKRLVRRPNESAEESKT